MQPLGTKENYLKTEVNHAVSSKTAAMIIYKGLFGFRYVGLNQLFDVIQIDDENFYNFKLNLDTTWYHDKTLLKLYKYNSIYMNFSFRKDTIPKRCENYYKTLTEEIYTNLKTSGDRVSKSKLKLVVKHLIKHISRLKFHKKFAVRYTRNPKYWKQYGKNLSWIYMDKVINYLSDKGHINNFTGGVMQGKDDICSMLLVNPELIKLCNGSTKEKVNIEECLLPPELPLVEIRNEDKLPRKPTKEEKLEVDNMAMVVREYCNLLAQKTISINGIQVPELFFRRIATVDLSKGCRWYDDGSIQQEDATSRSSTIIDQEGVVEVDYSSLHFCLAAEELGLDLKGKDPYAFPFEVSVDQEAVESWKKDYGFSEKYDPVRNLKKTALLTMFNAKSEKSAVSAIAKALKDDYRKEEPVKRKFVGITNVKVKELVSCLKHHNKEVGDYLMSGVGSRFQRLDSDMMTYCIQRFMEKGEVCIPIHDSIIVKQSLKEFAITCMEDAYENVMGSKVNCKVK
jgi:hypothetical protein